LITFSYAYAKINRKVNFFEATATSIDPQRSTVTCQSVTCDGNSCEIDDFEVTYDRLIFTIGAQSNTFGIPGVREHCCFLRQIEDARRIRTAIVNCFERANIPGLSDEARTNTLTFAVIGAGPTGVEFAAELRDFVEQDGPKYYPNLLKYVRIKIIEASNTVLAPFDKSLQDEAIKQLRRDITITDPTIRNQFPEDFQLTELLLETSVKEVKDSVIELNDGRSLSYGLAVWAAGNGPLPLTLQLIESLGTEQAEEQNGARGRVAIDPWCRVLGSNGKILAFGDCSYITTGQLPATAQVASQQGEYLASLFNKQYNFSPKPTEEGIVPPPTKDPNHRLSLSEAIASFASQAEDYAKPFQFLNLGILAYTGGGSALAQVSVAPETPNIQGKGRLGNAVWRSVYLSKQVSWRNRVLVMNDWAKRRVFGRDITQL
jgi:NADH dehydrogenase FAD-containing subunit